MRCIGQERHFLRARYLGAAQFKRDALRRHPRYAFREQLEWLLASLLLKKHFKQHEQDTGQL